MLYQFGVDNDYILRSLFYRHFCLPRIVSLEIRARKFAFIAREVLANGRNSRFGMEYDRFDPWKAGLNLLNRYYIFTFHIFHI